MPLGNSSESYGNLSIFVEHANKDRLKEEVKAPGYFKAMGCSTG